MKALIKEIDDNKKLIDYRLIDGTENLEYFAENGYTDEKDVEQSYTGDWYILGYAPQKSTEQLKSDIRIIRNIYLQSTDYTQLADVSLSQSEKQLFAQYRQYLRDYTDTPNWWLNNPKTFEDWKKELDNNL